MSSRAVGRLSTRLSSRAWVSASIQWRSSKRTTSGWTRLLRTLDAVKRLLLRESQVQREYLPGHLFVNLARVVARLDLKVGAQEVDDRKARGGFSVGGGSSLGGPLSP